MSVTKKRMSVGSTAFRTMVFTAVAVALLVCSGSAWAQTTDVLKVTYFDNNGVSGAPGAEIHVLNPQNGALCADVYVWRADQELSECCACPITPNGMFSFTVATATANPGDGGTTPVSGSIDIISDSTASCTDAAAGAPTPTPDLRAWATHVNADTVGTPTESAFDVTETPLLDAPLSSGELTEAAARCTFLQTNSSGAGRCDAICSSTVTPSVKKVVKK
jgi:hypothetical protein